MANQHYRIEEEVEVTIKLKVKLTHISNYQHLDDMALDRVVDDFKDEITDHLTGKLVNSYQEEVTTMCDWVDYEVEKTK